MVMAALMLRKQPSSCKKVFLEISQNSQENTWPESEACNLIKKGTLAQVFSCEFCEISKSNFSHRTPLVAASDVSMSQWLAMIYDE